MIDDSLLEKSIANHAMYNHTSYEYKRVVEDKVLTLASTVIIL